MNECKQKSKTFTFHSLYVDRNSRRYTHVWHIERAPEPVAQNCHVVSKGFHSIIGRETLWLNVASLLFESFVIQSDSVRESLIKRTPY